MFHISPPPKKNQSAINLAQVWPLVPLSRRKKLDPPLESVTKVMELSTVWFNYVNQHFVIDLGYSCTLFYFFMLEEEYLEKKQTIIYWLVTSMIIPFPKDIVLNSLMIMSTKNILVLSFVSTTKFYWINEIPRHNYTLL